MKKVGNYKRESHRSRDAQMRLNENEKLKTNKMEMKTNAQAVSEYRRSILFPNCKKCVVCLGSFSSATEICVKDEMYDEYMLDENFHLKRFDTFWICTHCHNLRTSTNRDKKSSNVIHLMSSMKDGGIVFFPSVDTDKIVSNVVHDEDKEFDGRISVYMPVSVDFLLGLNELPNISCSSECLHLNRKELLTQQDLCVLYTNQLFKYKNLVVNASLFKANSSTDGGRKLTNLEPVINDFKIRGSKSWIENQNLDLQSRMDQFGQTCLKLSIDLPLYNLECLASVLIQDGCVVTCSFDCNEMLEEVPSYWVHSNHNTSQPCFDNCPKVDLETFIVSSRY